MLETHTKYREYLGASPPGSLSSRASPSRLEGSSPSTVGGGFSSPWVLSPSAWVGTLSFVGGDDVATWSVLAEGLGLEAVGGTSMGVVEAKLARFGLGDFLLRFDMPPERLKTWMK